MTTTTVFDLRALARDILQRPNPPIGPEAVAKTLLAEIPEGQIYEALEQTMPVFARQMIVGQRMTSNRRPPRPSRKVKRIREAHQRRLDQLLNQGFHVSGDWKALRHCTYEDLLAISAERQEQAERNAAKARQYARWADLLREHGVDTFGDLPDDVLTTVLDPA